MNIQRYSFGSITIDGKRFHDDVIVFPDRVHAGWFRLRGHSLAMEDLQEVIRYEPDVLVVGTGAYGAMSVPDATERALKKRNITLVVDPTERACKRFNEYVSKGTKVVGALHLSC